MPQDAVVAEIRRIREEIAKEHNYDLHAILEALKTVPLPPGSTLVTLPPKQVEETPSTRKASAGV